MDEHSALIETNTLLEATNNTKGRKTAACRLRKLLGQIFAPKLLTSPLFLMYCLSQSMSLPLQYVTEDFLPEMMVHERGMSLIDTGNMIPIFGIGSVFGRVVLGIVLECFKGGSVLLCILNFTFLGGCCLGYVYCYTYTSYACISFANGVCFGVKQSLMPITLIELFGVGSITDGYGLVMISSAVTVTFGLPALGELIHQFDSYSSAFIVTSVLYFVSSMLSFLVLLLKKRN